MAPREKTALRGSNAGRAFYPRTTLHADRGRVRSRACRRNEKGARPTPRPFFLRWSFYLDAVAEFCMVEMTRLLTREPPTTFWSGAEAVAIAWAFTAAGSAIGVNGSAPREPRVTF